MNVTLKNQNKVEFATLHNGDVFQDEHSILMVTNEVENKYGGSYNAVDLETGELCLYYADDLVLLRKAELIVS